MGFRSCCVKFSKVFLIATNLFVLALGIISLGIGIWGAVEDTSYADVAADDDINFDAVPIVLIVFGCFVILLALFGCFGAVCGSKSLGKVLLVIYAIVMTLILMGLIAAGIAGYVERDEIDNRFRSSINDSFMSIPNNTRAFNEWNDAQEIVGCCGVNNWTDWLTIDWNDELESIPRSCCNRDCDNSTFYTVQQIMDDEIGIHMAGCTQEIIDMARDQVAVAGGIALAIGIILILAVVMSFIVVCAKKDYDSYDTV